MKFSKWSSELLVVLGVAVLAAALVAAIVALGRVTLQMLGVI